METLKEQHRQIKFAMQNKNLSVEDYLEMERKKDWIEQCYIAVYGGYNPDDDEPRAA